MAEPEAWLRGPVNGIPDPLQPVAHALMQAREESRAILRNFPDELLWARPAGVASVGFHLLHISGVVDRLFTYARGEMLTDAQRQNLERESLQTQPATVIDLLGAFDREVDRALDQLRATAPGALTQPREVGRKKLPATHLGLLFHAAEHTQRHVGQMLVTARVLMDTQRTFRNRL